MEQGAFDSQLLSLGRLNFLAAHCSLHKKFSASALSRLFVPAINHDSVRFFNNDTEQICAALIWARLSDEVSEKMIFDQTPPTEDEWSSGHNLWFLDILAPFDHGRIVARHIARNPPPEPFFFARLDDGGLVRKVVRGNATTKGKDRVQSFFIDAQNGVAA